MAALKAVYCAIYWTSILQGKSLFIHSIFIYGTSMSLYQLYPLSSSSSSLISYRQ